MSDQAKVMELLNRVPEHKMSQVLAFVKGIIEDEEKDDIICEKMIEEYMKDQNPDKKMLFSLRECLKEWGK